MKIEAVCAYCTVIFKIEAGAANRARRNGLKIYCSRVCSGYGRRINLTDEQKRAEKAQYDRTYRSLNQSIIKNKKADYHKRIYDPVQAAKRRRERMPRHVEYCRRPEYRRKKQAYDQEYRAKKEYGPLWESHILQLEIRREALAQMPDIDIRASKGTLNKCQKRRRDYEAAFRPKPEVGALGDLERGQRR